MEDENKKSPKEASKMFHNIIKASVKDKSNVKIKKIKKKD